MDAFYNPRGIGVSQVSRGMEPRAFDGNLMFSTGPNNELGVPNETACHLDIPMRKCSLSYRDLEEILAESGVGVDHATLNRRVVKCAPQIASRDQARKRPAARTWRMY